MGTATQPRPTPSSETASIPPLRNGDRLTVEEFERRYAAMPNLNKAELINGVVYMPSPVTFVDHGGPHFDLNGWLFLYRIATPGLRGADNSTLRIRHPSQPQPDGCLIVMPEYGGQVQIDAHGYILGGPELVDEVAATSENYDLNDKLAIYRAIDVQEYIVWRVFDQMIDWFRLRQGQYDRLLVDPDGICKSEVLPGLWLDPAALIRGDMMRVAEVSRMGIDSPEHAAFRARLQQARQQRP